DCGMRSLAGGFLPPVSHTNAEQGEQRDGNSEASERALRQQGGSESFCQLVWRSIYTRESIYPKFYRPEY
uniref:hypothetical protein n=1 Tax=Microcoleus sp. OTE_8_concoct_300 TaxID=2964710 RepID=UPI00403F5BCE